MKKRGYEVVEYEGGVRREWFIVHRSFIRRYAVRECCIHHAICQSVSKASAYKVRKALNEMEARDV